MLVKIAARNHFFPEFWKISKTKSTTHRRPFRQSLAGIFGNFKILAFQCHRSKVKTATSRAMVSNIALSDGKYIKKMLRQQLYNKANSGRIRESKRAFSDWNFFDWIILGLLLGGLRVLGSNAVWQSKGRLEALCSVRSP